MALPDGVFIKSARAWAVARADGTIETGITKTSPVARIPIVRVLYSIVQGLLAAIARRKRSLGRSRRDNVRLLVGFAATIAITFVGGEIFDDAPDWVLAWGTAAATLMLLRAFMPSALWRYHGAEHKAIAAFETFGRPVHAEQAMPISRIHDRCGTNAVFLVLLVTPLLTKNGLLLPAVLVAAEVIRYAVVKYPGAPVTRVLVAGGRFLQRTVTTVEPTLEELEVGCRAVEACVARHEELVSA
jgi:uncharacterized protein YqhQ